MKKEIWEEIEWGPYIVSTHGRIARIKEPYAPPGGYVRAPSVTYDGQKLPTYAHQLVAEVFLGKCPEGCEVHHINENKQDNRASNLEYVTRRDHVLISVQNRQHPMGEKHGNAKLTAEIVRECRKRYAAGGVTQQALADEHGVQVTAMRVALIRKTWRHVP